jgi:aromatic-amino-acid transaminase
MGATAIFPYADRRARPRRRGRRVVDGTLGVLRDDDGRLIVLPSVRRALAQVAPEDWAPYAPLDGESGYLDAVRQRVFGAGAAAAAGGVVAVATPGGTGAVKLALGAFLEPGQAALTTSHHWQPYAEIAAQHDRRLVTFDMFASAAAGAAGGGVGVGIDVAALERALAGLAARQGRALLILNDPCHNPTGYCMTAADWAAIADVVEARARHTPVTLVLDAAYADYAEAGLSRARPALERLSGQVTIAVAWSASKSLTAYGLRVGALLAIPAGRGGQRQLAAGLTQASLAGWGNCNRGGMLAVERLLTDPTLSGAVVSERRAIIDLLDGRGRLFRLAAARLGLAHPRHERGFFATVLCRRAGPVAQALRAEGALLVPGPGALRIALSAVSTADVMPAMAALARCLTEIDEGAA